MFLRVPKTFSIFNKNKFPVIYKHQMRRGCDFSEFNPTFWNEPKDNLDKAKWTENMINVMFQNLTEFSRNEILNKELLDKIQQDYNVNADGHTHNTFWWTLKEAKKYCDKVNDVINPNDNYYAITIKDNISTIIKRLTKIMKQNEKYWIAKPITFMYDDDDFEKLFDRCDLLSLGMLHVHRSDRILGYIYFCALNNLHEKKIYDMFE